MARREPPRRRRGSLGIGAPRWKKLRALLIALAIGFSVVGAYPTPGNLTLEKLEQGAGKRELDRWMERLRAWGFDADRDDVARLYVEFARGLDGTKEFVMRPVMPFLELTGTQQGWRLFSLPNEHPHVLRLAGERRGRRRVLYETWSREHEFLAETLEFRRVRALYNPGSQAPPNTYDAFARRLSERVFELEPGFERVVVSLEQRHTTLPGEPEDSRREERFIVILPRTER